MATSQFFIQPDQSNTNLVDDNSNEIRTETQKTRGRKPSGPKPNQPDVKKPRQRGMGVAYLERVRIEEEKKQMLENPPNPNQTFLTVPDVVLQGFPSYGGGCRSRLCCGGGGGGVWSGQICPWGCVENSTHGLSSISNPQVYNHPCDICFKKPRLDDGDQNVSKENDHPLQPDQRSKSQTGLFYDPKSDSGIKEGFGSFVEENPSNGFGGVKEYEFFPTKYGETVSVATPVGDCSPKTSTIDLTLKL